MDLTDLNVVLDPSVDPKAKLTIQAKDVTARNALDLALSTTKDATYEVWKGVVYVSVKGKAQKEPPAPALTEAAKKKLDSRFTFNFDESPIADVADFLSEAVGAKFGVAEKLDVKVTARLRRARIADALDVLCRVSGTKLEVEGEKVVFKKAS
jgi:hypothetical protein